ASPEAAGNIDCLMSKSGRYLLALGENGRLTIVDSGSREVVNVCEAEANCPKGYSGIRYHYTKATCACFDPHDEKIIYFCNFEGIHQWDWNKKRTPIGVFDAKKIAARNEFIVGSKLAKSPDGTMFSLVYGRTLLVMDLKDKRIRRFSTDREL